MEVDSCVPPGFRFHPTEVELVGYYLARKVASRKIDFEVIADIDLYRIEPWDLQGRCKLGYEDQNEWYFFSHKDKKYPTGTRTNRATSAGFWKATGRDKAVVSNTRIIGMRKTLVFYVGRAPNGRKTDWIIHEYRLQSNEDDPPQEEGWVVCRAFKKQTPNQRPGLFNASNPNYYVKGQNQFGLEGFTDFPQSSTQYAESLFWSNPQEQPLKGAFENKSSNNNRAFEIPALDSPTLFTGFETNECFDAKFTDYKEYRDHIRSENEGQFVDWKVLDKLLASQMSESTLCSSPNITSQHDDFLAPFDS